jgi:hypothetical protein
MPRANLALVILFFIAWSAVTGSYLYFALHVAPLSLARWAEQYGYRIIEKRLAGPLDWFSCAKGSGHQVYRVVVIDEDGQTRSGLAQVGTPYWFCLSSSRCPVVLQWDTTTDQSRRTQPTTRPTILCFAAADLVLAAFVLALIVTFLFVLAMSFDAMWNGSLGLNHFFGRAVRPEAASETRMVMLQALGFLALYVPAFVALTIGGIGLIGRKPWAYYWHIAGSALVAVTGFGILYTIPALFIALRPSFKESVSRRGRTKPAMDLLGDR